MCAARLPAPVKQGSEAAERKIKKTCQSEKKGEKGEEPPASQRRKRKGLRGNLLACSSPFFKKKRRKASPSCRSSKGCRINSTGGVTANVRAWGKKVFFFEASRA